MNHQLTADCQRLQVKKVNLFVLPASSMMSGLAKLRGACSLKAAFQHAAQAQLAAVQLGLLTGQQAVHVLHAWQVVVS